MLDGFNMGWTDADRRFILLAANKDSMFDDFLLVASTRSKRKISVLNAEAETQPAVGEATAVGWAGPTAHIDRGQPIQPEDNTAYEIDKMARSPPPNLSYVAAVQRSQCRIWPTALPKLIYCYFTAVLQLTFLPVLDMMVEHPQRGEIIDTSSEHSLVNNVAVAMLVLYKDEALPTWTIIPNFGVFINIELCRQETSCISYLEGIAGALGYPAGFINPATVVPFMRATVAEMNFFQRELVKMTSSLGHRSLSGELSPFCYCQHLVF